MSCNCQRWNAYEHYQEELHDQASFVLSTYGAGKWEGRPEGEAALLTRQLQHRFGAVPEWASEKIAEAEPSSLEKWSLRFVDAQSLGGVFSDKV
ncbi:MAG: DUF4351 domain-containing protein [Magnetococcales bacterium]|nr:DUF4351 domain-containing protein [Magnetococcales bacterium]